MWRDRGRETGGVGVGSGLDIIYGERERDREKGTRVGKRLGDMEKDRG